MSHRPLFFLGFLCNALLVACGASLSATETLESQIEALLTEEILVQRTYPFMTVYVETAEGEVLASTGKAHPDFFSDLNAPTNNDWMRIWSMSKLVTIVLTLDLAEDGILGLSDHVIEYIPEFAQLKVARPKAGGSIARLSAQSYESNDLSGLGTGACDYTLESPTRPMTIRDLMVHTAGFYYADLNIPCLAHAQAALELPLAQSADEWLAGISTLPLIQSPGEDYYYGLNTTVLGFALERASGKSLQTLLEERITKPYGISGLSFLVPDSATLPPRISGKEGQLRLARPLELDILGGHQPPYGSDTSLFLGGEGLVATAPGFAKFLRAVFFSEESGVIPLLEAASIEAMTSPQINADSGWGAMGYALWLSNGRRPDGTYGRANIWTGGGYEGTRYWIDPEKKRVGVLMTQVYMPPASGVSIEDKIRDTLDAAY